MTTDWEQFQIKYSEYLYFFNFFVVVCLFACLFVCFFLSFVVVVLLLAR